MARLTLVILAALAVLAVAGCVKEDYRRERHCHARSFPTH